MSFVGARPRNSITGEHSAPDSLGPTMGENHPSGVSGRNGTALYEIGKMRLLLTRGRGMLGGAMCHLLKEAKNRAVCCCTPPSKAGRLVTLPPMWRDAEHLVGIGFDLNWRFLGGSIPPVGVFRLIPLLDRAYGGFVPFAWIC